MIQTANTATTSRRPHYGLLCLALIITILAGAAIFWQHLPYQNAAGSKLRETLESKGIPVSSLIVEDMNNSGATLSTIELGTVQKLNIEKITAKFDMQKLLLGKTTELNAAITNLDLSAPPYQVSAANIDLTSSFNRKLNQWQGKINILSLIISGTPTAIPALSVNIDFTMKDGKLTATTIAKDSEDSTNGVIDISLPTANYKQGALHIKHIQFPWGGGLISTDSVNIPLDMQTPIAVTLNMLNMDISDTLGKVSEGKIDGTGKLAGSLPIIYNPDGSIILQNGKAQAINTGTISVSPDLLPGDNPQLALARETLENFHYTKLSVMISSAGERSAINLALEGKNPDAPEARPVKFNINLTGDILPLIQQSILPFNDVKELLKEETK